MTERRFKKKLRKLHTAYLRLLAKPNSPRRQAMLREEQKK